VTFDEDDGAWSYIGLDNKSIPLHAATLNLGWVDEAVILHEFGHVLGLAHVDSPGELMYVHNVGRTTYGPGDVEGLRLLGRGPCL